MAIDKVRLFERTRERWPLTVRVLPTTGVPSFEAHPCLVDVHEAVEVSCAPAGEWTAEDEWIGLANWSFHQALWALAERSGERHLHRDEVTFDMFDDCMRSNLTDECWNAERVDYEESPLRFH